jgi:hypothetical protein
MPRIRNVILDDDLTELADKEAKRLGISFAAFIRLLINQYFDDIRFERRREDIQNESQESNRMAGIGQKER